ncbi:MAG: hypothetical protein HRU24_13290 [Gammaproteobacteria bacterium]|nr:hypothetical protein [Gammaproteobacteria bacterium]
MANMREIRIIKSFDYDDEVETYIPWFTDSDIYLMVENNLIFQFEVEGRSFVALSKHWEEYRASDHKLIYAT